MPEIPNQIRGIRGEDDDGGRTLLDWGLGEEGGWSSSVLDLLSSTKSSCAREEANLGPAPHAISKHGPPDRSGWTIYVNLQPSPALPSTGRRRGDHQVGGGEVMRSLAVASLPHFPPFFSFNLKDQARLAVSSSTEERSRRRTGHDQSPDARKLGCLILFFPFGGASFAVCVKGSTSICYFSIPSMAYRRKQGAADDRRSSYPQDSASTYSYTSFKTINEEPKLGLWQTLASKAKGILDEDALAHKFEDFKKERPRSNTSSSSGDQAPQSRWSFENHWKTGEAAARIRPEALSASVNQLGGRIKNALEEGLTIVDNKTSSIIEETKKIQIRRKSATSSSYMSNSAVPTVSSPNLSFDQAKKSATEETQLKASRDVANAMAAKAKLLLRELKSVKADLAFAKQRCAQLEEENKLLRETKQKGSKTEEDDDLIRVQLETLLAEKSRLAQENSTYARENRFLREIVDFHQFSTTQDVVSLDDDDVEDDDPAEEDSNLIYTENMLPAVEENSGDELSPVPSRPQSPMVCPEESSSPISSNASKPGASAFDTT